MNSKFIILSGESPFDKSGFTGFIKNLLNRIDDASFIYQGNYIPDAYKQYIKTLERIGKFSDGENRWRLLYQEKSEEKDNIQFYEHSARISPTRPCYFGKQIHQY